VSATAPQPVRDKLAGALLRYRIMAFTTGTVLVLGTIALILQKVADVDHMDVPNAILWVTHGYLFLVYLIVTLQLGLKRRWPIVRLVLVMAAGTIPTMSFVAEHFVTREVRGSAADGVGGA
jgi:integral membrane protein